MDSTFGDVPESSVRVLIADEYANRRRTIRRALIADATVHVVGEAVDFDELLVEVETRQPRVLVVSEDVLRERMEVAHAQLRAVGDDVRTLMLTDSPAAASACAPLRSYLWGCLNYSRVADDLVRAVVAIAGGEMWFSRRQLAAMLRERAERAVPVPTEQMILQGLTCREIEVVRLIARGRTNKEIAQAMNISDLTVKTHVQNIFKKCRLRRRAELPRQMVAA
jgi:DNA-binding NarL/FixJ family response regulator